MNRFRFDDDVFSPIRVDTSTVDSSDNSEGSISDLLNAEMTLAFADAFKNMNAPVKNVMKTSRKSDLNLSSKDQSIIAKDFESLNACSAVSERSSSKSSGFKKLASDKKKDLEEKNVLKKDSVNLQMKKGSLPKENIFDCHTLKSESSEQIVQKRNSRPTSLLLSKDNHTKFNKDTKTKKQSSNQSSKNICIDRKHKSNVKHSSERMLIDESLDFKKNLNDVKTKDSSVKSSKSKKISPVSDSVNKKENDASQHLEKLEVDSNPVHNQYEESVQKIVHDCVSFETSKIRQSFYMQQMCFYREINKTKNAMEQQHLETTERLFKVIEDLMQMNAILKLTLVDKN